MAASISRRSALAACLLFVSSSSARAAQRLGLQDARARLAEVERESGGRLGVSILKPAEGIRAGHRENERFLLCSTFKMLAAAFVLARVDRGEEQLDRRIAVARRDIISWSPVTKTRIGRPGMTVAELCDAAVGMSDNAAANLLFKSFGGPPALTAYLRTLGDRVTRLDRIEPALNEHDAPDDVRDTTSPSAMVETMGRLIFGDALSRASRTQLAAWLIGGKTGDRRLRAGIPAGWLVGDKTGTNGSGTANDVGVAWPPTGAAVLVAGFYRHPDAAADARDAVLAEVGRVAAKV